MKESKLDILKFNINRIDGYIEKADNKANFLLALNGIIIGIIFSKSTEILEFIKKSQSWVIVNSISWICIITFCIVSIVFSLLAINPRKSKNQTTYKSILYYKDITDAKVYIRRFNRKTSTDKKIVNEFCIQVVELSKICDKKMICINQSILFLKVYWSISILYGLIYCINYIH
ncbi:MAG: hypothetical protein KZY55_15715 [Paeniclostridium sp.]|nr:Pycsar system effector family protein [Paeniclostridium sp.]MBW4862150.1 hypothetical protein [Paeniclostridium sp.]MBW4875504.1 hypothetical protein [Paeniclostridium sp.]